MKVKKPNWTPLELIKNYRRWEVLIDQTASHKERNSDCLCNLCLECYGLSANLDTFSEEEHVAAIIEENKFLGAKNNEFN